MGTSQREASAAADHFLLKIARDHPLQSLTPKELQLDITPVTVYPKPVRAKAWVRFAHIPHHVDCWIVRTTADAAGISFTIEQYVVDRKVNNSRTVDRDDPTVIAPNPAST